jgi:cytochrome c
MRNAVYVLLLVCSFLLSACGGTSRMEARAMKNPVEATPASIASGKFLYEQHCASCHGAGGKGDGEKAQTLIGRGLPRPSNLTDDKWDFGSTDGEIFVNIRDGVGTRGAMEGLKEKPGISDTDMWNIVNYVHTLRK